MVSGIGVANQFAMPGNQLKLALFVPVADSTFFGICVAPSSDRSSSQPSTALIVGSKYAALYRIRPPTE